MTAEPMVRVVSMVCERHGEVITAEGTAAYRPVTGSARRLREVLSTGASCVTCYLEGQPLPHRVLIATEPVVEKEL